MRRLLCLLLLFLVAAPAWAQDATPEATSEAAVPVSTELSYSSPVQGALDNSAFEQDWTLATASADRIRVDVERVDGNLVPEVAILDANGQELRASYGPNLDFASAEIDTYTLPTAGTFTVRVRRLEGETGATSGTYRLTVAPLGTAEDNPNNTTVIGSVEYDTPIEGEITGAHWQHRYTFTAPAADTLHVRADRVSGTLFPEVYLLDANGTPLSTGYGDSEGDAAQIDSVTLPAGGTYTVMVTRQQGIGGETSGEYRLEVALLGAGDGSPTLSEIAGELNYDTAVTGKITPARRYEDWRLTAEAGDTITISVERASEGGETLQPMVILLGGSNQELTRGYANGTGANAAIERYTLQGPGTYTIRVTRANEQRGTTTGGYRLLVTLEGAGEGNPTLAAQPGDLTLDEPVEGEITGARWQETWTFMGEAGTQFDVQVTRTDGTLVPRLEIRDANGQTLTSAYYEPSRDAARISNYTLPGSGQYQIVVFRDGGQAGATTGGYRLVVRPPAE
jgi:hypothetical protein